MKEVLKRIKRVATEDFKIFFEPYVWVWRATRRAISFLFRQIKLLFNHRKKSKDE
ncbi:hypothetical protein [Massilia sp.]|uniref:hypothetical protein n=1 Tax=Massilia sp. TaxID=1882437 RepID=UPI00352C78F5